MQQVIIKYKNLKTLMLLKDLAKYFDFVISIPQKKTTKTINGVTIIPGDNSIDTSELTKIFTEKNIDTKKLRQEAWQRRK